MVKAHEHDPLPMLPWYCRDWFASDAFAAMSLEAQGAYRNLLDRAWQRPGCTLPNDPERLRELAKASPEEWERVRDVVLKWLPESKQRRSSHRLLREWKEARARRTFSRERAAEAAKARWEKEKAQQQEQSSRNARASSKHVIKHARSSPSPPSNGHPLSPSATRVFHSPGSNSGTATPPNPPATAGGRLDKARLRKERREAKAVLEDRLEQAHQFALHAKASWTKPARRTVRGWLDNGATLADVQRLIEQGEHLARSKL